MEQNKTQLKTLYETGLLEQSKYNELVNAMDAQVNAPLPTWKRLEKIIVCFFADGSEKYTNMTVLALSTFLDKTPAIKVGLLAHSNEIRDNILQRIEQRHHDRIIHKLTSETPPLSETWNPTQYKLDIAKFIEDGFEDIFWMDSDTYSYDDMTQFLLQFADSKAQFFFVKDHVMFNSDFVANWSQQRKLGTIPQACFMGFKSTIIPQFFKLWRNIWEEWINPFPFARYPDPNPSFPGSMFCIEQYALSMALDQFLKDHNLGEEAVILFDRELLLIQHDGRIKVDIVTQNILNGTSYSGISGLSALRLSGLNLSTLQTSGINISGLKFYSNISGVNVSGLNVSGLNVSGLSALFSSLQLSGLNLSGLDISGGSLTQYLSSLYGSALNVSGISGISIEEFLGRLGQNFSGLNLSGLTLSELEERLKSTGALNLGGIDYRHLQGGEGNTSGVYSPNLSLVDRFGNSFIHYYNQNFELFNQQQQQK